MSAQSEAAVDRKATDEYSGFAAPNERVKQRCTERRQRYGLRTATGCPAAIAQRSCIRS